MNRKNLILYTVFSFILGQNNKTYAQQDSISPYSASIRLETGYINKQSVPLWMRANQFGSTPVAGASLGAIAQVLKNYKQTAWSGKSQSPNNSFWDWGFGFEGRANVGSKANAQLIDAHVKVKFAMLEAKVGRSKDMMGLNGDSLLTSGNFAISGNSLGVPKIELSIPSYYRIPLLDGLFSLKGNFALGFMGDMEMNKSAFRVKTANYMLPTYMLSNSLYGRLGKADWKLQLFAGLNHQAQWGGEEKRYGADYDLNFLQTLQHVAFGKSYGGQGNPIPRSKIGNQQGSIDLGASYNFGSLTLMAYRQNFYDVGAIGKLANINDGLNGITLTNNKFNSKKNKNWDWKSLLIEFFYSKDQAGYPHSKATSSGDEDYYNNSEYNEGWSYKQSGIGSPLIATAASVRPGQAHYPKDFFISNRVVAGHIGASAKLYQWNLLSKISLARHYGTFATSEYGKSTGKQFHTPYKDSFIPVNQFSFYLQAEREVFRKIILGATFASDQGKLLYSGSGLLLHARKSF